MVLDMTDMYMVGKEDRVLERYFPLEERLDPVVGASRTEEREIRRLHATMLGEGGDSLRPGEGYGLYHGRDVLGTLPREMEAVVGRAAGVVGVEALVVVGVVETYSRRLVRWWTVKKRRSRESR